MNMKKSLTVFFIAAVALTFSLGNAYARLDGPNMETCKTINGRVVCVGTPYVDSISKR